MRPHHFVSAAALMASAVPLLAQNPAATSSSGLSLLGRAVPAPAQMSAGPQKDLVLYGQALSTRTFVLIGPEVADSTMRHAGNNLACTSCHQAGATMPFAMPWV